MAKAEKRAPGRPRKYPLIDLKVGELFVICKDGYDDIKAARMSALKDASRRGYVYVTKKTGSTITVKRVE